MSASIIVTVPKYVAISPSPLRRISTSSPISPMSIDQMEDSGRGKKRRLDHLTWEEKIQRKKLKNRVAAQTSRDRKKAKMDEMESTIKTLTLQTDILRNKCDTLESINQSLLDKNSKLDRQVQELQQQIEELQRQQSLQNAPPETGCVGFSSNNSLRSAVSNYPLQKGMELKSTRRDLKESTHKATLWKIVALCLLYKTCSKTSTQANLRSLPRAYSQISPQTWKALIQQAAMMMPKAQAVQSDCLDQWWGPQQKSWNPAKISLAA